MTTAPPKKAAAAEATTAKPNPTKGSSSRDLSKCGGLVAAIKSRLTLREAARMVGVELPERDGAKFRSPLRPDRSPSCTIHGETMRDWSRGESFDAIGFFAAARGLDNAEAVRTLAAQLGLAGGQRGANADRPAAAPAPVATKASRVTFDATEPSAEDFAAILRTRRWPAEAEAGLVAADAAGVLRFAAVGTFPSWLVTDQSRRIAEARRLDGQPFPPVGSLDERKAHTLKGSKKSWPCGLAPRVEPQALRQLPLVLVEGGPDLLALFAVLGALRGSAANVLPVAMLGTSATISPEALDLMRGRPCIVLAHGDDAGREAARRWAEQLAAAGCRVTVRALPEGRDLADLLTETQPAALAALLALP